MMHVLGACRFFYGLSPPAPTDSLYFSIISMFYFCLQALTLGILINYKVRNAWNKNGKGTCLFDTRTKLVTQKKIKMSLASASQDFLQLHSMLFSTFPHSFQVPDLVLSLVTGWGAMANYHSRFWFQLQHLTLLRWQKGPGQHLQGSFCGHCMYWVVW